MVLELGFGVERLRRRGGDYGGGGRRRSAGAEPDKRGAGGEDAKALGHWRSLLRTRQVTIESGRAAKAARRLRLSAAVRAIVSFRVLSFTGARAASPIAADKVAEKRD